MRRDVIQADIPNAVIRTVEENIDPRNPPKRPVQVVHGTLYHGTGSVDENVVHGIPSFIQKKSRKHRKNPHHAEHHAVPAHHAAPHHAQHHAVGESHALRSQALANAAMAEGKATNMLYGITNNPVENPHMILGVDLINRYEQPDIKLHEHNAALHDRIKKLRNTPAGVRAAHTFRKLPLP
jgi:hypothetical protein